MKKELTSLDIFFLLKEFQQIIGSKIDKIFQKGDDFLFQIHQPSVGKKYVRVLLPGIMYLAETKEETEASDNFALSLRKHISNARIKNIEQKGFERIIEILLESKNNFRLYIELFSPGNIILCDPDDKIIMASTYKGFGSRMIRPGIKYEYPKKEFNLLELSEVELKTLLESSSKSSIVVTLATDLGVGGTYSEELCNIAGIDKKKTSLDDKEIKKLHDTVIDIIQRKPEGYTYKEESGFQITPFELSDRRFSSRLESFNKAIEENFTKISKPDKPRENKILKEKQRISTMIFSQEARISGLLKSADESQRKGEMIYESYGLIKAILDGLKSAREKYTWHEIKERLKEHKEIKEIDEQHKKIVIDL